MPRTGEAVRPDPGQTVSVLGTRSGMCPGSTVSRQRLRKRVRRMRRTGSPAKGCPGSTVSRQRLRKRVRRMRRTGSPA